MFRVDTETVRSIADTIALSEVVSLALDFDSCFFRGKHAGDLHSCRRPWSSKPSSLGCRRLAQPTCR